MCLTPVTLTREYAGRYYINNVPCNNCLECVKDRQNEYIVRTVEEQRKRGTMCFFTLTYSPQALPMTEDLEIDENTGEILNASSGVQTLRRSDVTYWLHAFRKKYKRLGLKCDFGHLICGEYGPRTFRPHYHGVILGLQKEDIDILMKMWSDKYGFVQYTMIPSLIKDVESVARYCSKYICKNKDWNIIPEGAEKPRKMTSQFYGMPNEKRWNGMVRYYQAQDIMEYNPEKPKFKNKAEMYKVVDEIIRRRKISIGNGKSFKLPNYYKRKIFYSKNEGKICSMEIQRMVTYYVQRNHDEDFKAELHNLATLYDLGTYAEAVDRYNMVHEDDLFYRALRYEESDNKYMRKSVF